MRSIVFVFVLGFLSFITQAQSPAHYAGGRSEMLKFLAKNTRYPTASQEENAQGIVRASFTVGKDGIIQEAKANGENSGLSEEVLRVIQTMPKWQAAKDKNGQPIISTHELVFAFVIDSKNAAITRLPEAEKADLVVTTYRD
ncbi:MULTISPECIES: energy transducer TonB [unclassified Siphonobacter]|uniref:energy transducer TonB n=1 Tax=unclassified Siphonobacter TaxID=2635712 RepID=UPI0027832206|nr:MULTISPECIES: energy transducer TonB [unclassified Siphonobacter]MDQ1087648.1 outer membrane biosynthesis protein TonB [Siphonobacter sp. SORGH_AS_1065]MDR6193797.1 outer membrane biosynthesis protein TonB [Siphonobacter sp. SORGH_AS_0500]